VYIRVVGINIYAIAIETRTEYLTLGGDIWGNADSEISQHEFIAGLKAKAISIPEKDR
jgi:hypothetical protein